MAAAVANKTREDVKQYNFAWVGKDKAGKVVSVLVKNGDPVEFGQSLFVIE